MKKNNQAEPYRIEPARQLVQDFLDDQIVKHRSWLDNISNEREYDAILGIYNALKDIRLRFMQREYPLMLDRDSLVATLSQSLAALHVQPGDVEG